LGTGSGKGLDLSSRDSTLQFDGGMFLT